MAETLLFELVSPERLVLSQPVEMVVVPGAEGDFGALPHHAPLISAVRPGVIDIYEGGKVTNRIFVAGGVAEVTGDRCTVLAEETMAVKDLDTTTIAARTAEAEKALAAAANDFERDQAKLALLVAQTMLQVTQEKPAAH